MTPRLNALFIVTAITFARVPFVLLFMALALGTLCAGALRGGGLPNWVAAFGLVAAAALFLTVLPVFGGPDAMPIAVAVSLLSFWMLATGVRFLRADAAR